MLWTLNMSLFDRGLEYRASASLREDASLLQIPVIVNAKSG
jgi:hypothetical protein